MCWIFAIILLGFTSSPMVVVSVSSIVIRHWKNLLLVCSHCQPLPALSCLLHLCQPRSHIGLVLFVEVAEDEGAGDQLLEDLARIVEDVSERAIPVGLVNPG